jgi:hypothetical protein
MIYWVRVGKTEAVKVGWTSGNVAGRLRSLQTGSVLPLVVLRTAKGGRDTEAALHRLYRPKHIRAEFFRLTDEDVAVDITNLQTKNETPPSRPLIVLPDVMTLEAMLDAWRQLGVPETEWHVAVAFWNEVRNRGAAA